MNHPMNEANQNVEGDAETARAQVKAQAETLQGLSRMAPHAGVRVDPVDSAVVASCGHCQREDRKKYPLPIEELMRNPQRMPAGFDEELLAFLVEFHRDHAKCQAANAASARR